VSKDLLEHILTVGYGGALEMQLKPYLLLKDGTIYRNVLGPPKDMDIERSRQVEPKMWGPMAEKRNEHNCAME
jgi:hypothetical protein